MAEDVEALQPGRSSAASTSASVKWRWRCISGGDRRRVPGLQRLDLEARFGDLSRAPARGSPVPRQTRSSAGRRSTITSSAKKVR